MNPPSERRRRTGVRAVILTATVVTAMLSGAGCAPQASFKPETFQLAQGRLRIKGWLRGGLFSVDVRFVPRTKNLSLHSLALVTPSGEAHAPDTSRDKTPKAPRISVGVGMGIPLGGGEHGHHGGSERSEWALAPGVSVPLAGGGRKPVTAVEACWNVTAEQQTAPVTGCTLHVKLISVARGSVQVTIVPLVMAFHEDAGSQRVEVGTTRGTGGPPAATTRLAAAPATQPGKEDRPSQPTKKRTRGLVREIDFTLKDQPTTKSIDL